MFNFVRKQGAKIIKKVMTVIRKANRAEADTIVRFQVLMARETESLSLDEGILKQGVEAVFNHPERGCYYVAKKDGRVIASLMITYEWSDWRNSTVYWIQSVYVEKAFRRQGVYASMYQHIRQLAENDPAVGGIRLYVDKSNLPAQHTYASLGMNGEHYQVFEWMKSF